MISRVSDKWEPRERTEQLLSELRNEVADYRNEALLSGEKATLTYQWLESKLDDPKYEFLRRIKGTPPEKSDCLIWFQTDEKFGIGLNDAGETVHQIR